MRSQNTHRHIESPQNPDFKIYKSLETSSGIKKHQMFLISGTKVVADTLTQSSENILAVLGTQEMSSTMSSLANFVRDKSQAKVRFTYLSDALFNELDFSGTHHPLLVAKLPEIPKAKLEDTPKGLELLVPVGDPNNLGALLRTALAFEVPCVLLSQSAHPYHPKCLRAFAHNPFLMPIRRGPSIDHIDDLEFAVLDRGGKNISNYSWPKSFRILVGEEGPGIPERFKNRETLSVYTSPKVESLNASTTVALALYSYKNHLS